MYKHAITNYCFNINEQLIQRFIQLIANSFKNLTLNLFYNYYVGADFQRFNGSWLQHTQNLILCKTIQA